MTDLSSQPELEGWDLSAVALLLSARSEQAAESAWVDALPALSERFDPNVWNASYSVNPYGAGAHSNLYNVEGQRDFKLWLEQNSVSVEDYAAAVGPIQYVSAELHLLSLLPRARSNKGWRVRAIGFPSIGIVACGLGSHYQGTQNQNEMGRASELIRARALEVLTGEAKHALEQWPSATATDWEERGLMSGPIHHIGSLDISGFDEGRGAKLRMVRNTTVKKELATFFAVRGLTLDEFHNSGAECLLTLRDIALELGRPELV